MYIFVMYFQPFLPFLPFHSVIFININSILAYYIIFVTTEPLFGFNKCVLYFIIYTKSEINALFYFRGTHPYFKTLHFCV